MSGLVKVGGAWKDVAGMSVKVDGAWKTVDKGYTNIAGTWKEFYAPVAGAFDFLQTTVLSSNAGTVTLSNLDAFAEYKQLQIRMSVKAGAGDPNTDRLRVKVNNSDANLRGHSISATTASNLGSGTRTPYGGSLVFTDRLDNVNYTAIVLDIMNPFSSNNKTMRALVGTNHSVSGESVMEFLSIGYFSSTPITSLTFGVGNTSMSSTVAANSRFSIYGIR